ncbi:DUF1189 domain-containing protein [Bacillaceae bacterium IKA-2]|nr:DUF1189 domain-containing protein [Bacillaceae bacterium IKA-2]
MNIFRQLFKSIYSPPTVAKFRFQGIGKTILYVFMLMLVTLSVTAFQLGSTVSDGVKQFQTVLVTELPEFELKNSILLSDLDEPLYIEVDGENYIFDTTGTLTTTDIEQNHNQVLALLQKEAVYITNGTTQSIRYGELGSLDLTKADLEGLTETIVGLLPLIITIIVIVLYIVLTALKYIGIFFLSLFGLIVRSKAGLKLSYKQVWVLSAYAVTLPTVFFAVTNSLNIYIPFSLTLYWLVAFIMLYLIFKEIQKPVDNE